MSSDTSDITPPPISTVFNNATVGDDFSKQMRDAFQIICDVLGPHCGPYALNAIIGTRARVVVEADIITKDGISIADQLLSDKNPVARFACRVSRFLGSITDKRCHDGTTTAMLLFATLCKTYYTMLQKNTSRAERYVHVQSLIETTQNMLDVVEASRITVEDILKLAQAYNPSVTHYTATRAVAYQTAMIASKGDAQLSSVIADIVATTPIDLHGLFIRTLAPNENSPRVCKVVQPHQFELRCAVGASVFNTDMRQKLHAPNAVVFSTANKLIKDDPLHDMLVKLLSGDARSIHELTNMGLDPWEDAHDGRHLIIITPQLNSLLLGSLIDQFNTNHPSNPIVIVNSHVSPKAQVWMNNCLYGLRGVLSPEELPMSEMHKAFLDNLDVRYGGFSLTIDGLYERDGGVLNPYYVDPSLSPIYTHVVSECDRLLKERSDNPLKSGMNENEVNECIYFYRFLCCQQIVDAQLGGLVHENKTLQTVYNDAMGSATSAVTHGVVSDVFVRLLSTLSSGLGTIGDICWADSLIELLSTIHFTDFKDFMRTLQSDLTGKYTSVLTDPQSQTQSFQDLSDHDVIAQFLDPNAKKPTVLIQPYIGAREQVLRVGDLFPKIAGSNLLIDTGHLDHVEYRNDPA